MSNVTKELSKEPSQGDLVLHCGHVLRAKKHSFYAPDGIQYRRPDGSVHKSHWLIICEECRQECGGDPSKVKIKGDGVWDSRHTRQ